MHLRILFVPLAAVSEMDAHAWRMLYKKLITKPFILYGIKMREIGDRKNQVTNDDNNDSGTHVKVS